MGDLIRTLLKQRGKGDMHAFPTAVVVHALREGYVERLNVGRRAKYNLRLTEVGKAFGRVIR